MTCSWPWIDTTSVNYIPVKKKTKTKTHFALDRIVLNPIAYLDQFGLLTNLFNTWKDG